MKSRTDLVLIDVELPGADGWAMNRFRSDSTDLRSIPVVIFTSSGAREDFDQARQFNLAGFFTKPYATADVLRQVQNVVAPRSLKPFA